MRPIDEVHVLLIFNDFTYKERQEITPIKGFYIEEDFP